MSEKVEPERVTVHFVCEQHEKQTESEELASAIFNGEPLCSLCDSSMVIDTVEIE